MRNEKPLRAPEDASPATWLAQRSKKPGLEVGALLPPGYEAYARIFHPARRRQGDDYVPVTWRDVAHHNSRTPHRGMQWPCIIGRGYMSRAYQGQAGLWDEPPEEGTLPRHVASATRSILASHTDTGDAVNFAVWEGFAGLDLPTCPLPKFRMGARVMLLLSGPLEAATTSLAKEPFWQTASLWWPRDRAWCVSTEVDLMTTYVGASRSCIDSLLAHESLEVAQAELNDCVVSASDTINCMSE